MATISELRQRWHGPGGPRLVRAVQNWLMGKSPRPVGLSEVDGRVDLRGISVAGTPLVVGDKDNPTAGVHWQSLDLRRAQIVDARFFGARIENCLFDSATLLDCRFWGTEIIDCSFHRADIRSQALGSGDWHGRRTIWRRVIFDRATMIDSAFVGCGLIECTFDTVSGSMLMQDCDVIDCVFRGATDRLVIDGRGHRFPVSPQSLSADFGAAVFNNSEIVGYNLDRVRLPDQDDLFVARNYPTTFRRAAAWLSEQVGDGAHDALAILEYALKAPGAEDSDACLGLRGVGGPELESAMRQAFAHAQDSGPDSLRRPS